jgi:hypothetical protein
MTQTSWGVEGVDEEDIELGSRTFSPNDDGASMMCNLVCLPMGRHVHIDYCISNGEPCKSDDVRHINARITPNPDRPKDAITHSLYWRRMGTFVSFFYLLHTQTPSPGFKGQAPTCFTQMCTEIYEQTHTLVMNRSTSENGEFVSKE